MPSTRTRVNKTATVIVPVSDQDAAIDFYCRRLGFHEDMHPASTFAMLSHEDLRLVLSAAGGGPGGGQAMPDGTMPEPGGGKAPQLFVRHIRHVDIEHQLAIQRPRQQVCHQFGGDAGAGLEVTAAAGCRAQ